MYVYSSSSVTTGLTRDSQDLRSLPNKPWRSSFVADFGTTHEWTKYSWDTHGPPPKRRGAGAKKKVPYVPRTFVEVGRNQAISHKKWYLGFVFRFERLKMER